MSPTSAVPADSPLPTPTGTSTAAGPAVPRGLAVVLGIAGTVVAVAGLQGAAGIIGPVFLALVLTVAVNPVQHALERRGVPRWLAVVTALLCVYLTLLGLAVALVVSVARLATLLPDYAAEFDGMVAQVEALLVRFDVGEEQVRTAVEQLDLGNLFGLLQRFLAGLLGVFSNLFFVLAVLLFMGLDAADFPRRLALTATVRPHLVAALSAFAGGTRRYLAVSTIFGFIVAVLDTIALAFMGIPLPLLWGLLAFITNYIPNVGFVIGVIPPALLGLLEGGWQLAVLVIAVYSVINFVVQSVIQPKYVGDAVGLSATLTFLSLVFWAWVLGPLGALLAIPLSLLAKALLVDADPSTRWVNALIGTGPVPAPPPEHPQERAVVAAAETEPGPEAGRPQ